MPNSQPEAKKKVMPSISSISTALIILHEARSAGYALQRAKLGGAGVFQMGSVRSQEDNSRRSRPSYKSRKHCLTYENQNKIESETYLEPCYHFRDRPFILDNKGEATSTFTYIDRRARKAFDFADANRVDG